MGQKVLRGRVFRERKRDLTKSFPEESIALMRPHSIPIIATFHQTLWRKIEWRKEGVHKKLLLVVLVLARVKQSRISIDQLGLADLCRQLKKRDDINIARRLREKLFFVFQEATVQPLKPIRQTDGMKRRTVAQKTLQNGDSFG